MTDSAGLHQHHIARILAFLAQHRLPGMFQATENVEAGREATGRRFLPKPTA